MARTGAETRELLVETALRLFREQGFDGTTMRGIAKEAGVSLGNAYHYFAGKDELVQELYRVVQVEHRDRALPRLDPGVPLAENLRTTLHTGLDVMAPYHAFGQAFVRVALPSSSPASPFSPESAGPRELAVDLMRTVIETSGTRVPARLRERLPHLLWLAYLGVTLHWVTDGSPDQRRTRRLVDGLAPVVGRALSLSRLPVARGLVDDVLTLATGLEETDHPSKEDA